MQTEGGTEVMIEFAAALKGQSEGFNASLEVSLRGGDTDSHRFDQIRPDQYIFYLCALIKEGALVVGDQPWVACGLDVKKLTVESASIDITPEFAVIVYTVFQELKKRYENEIHVGEFELIEELIDDILYS